MIFITHDIALINEVATDLLVMYGGQAVEYGPVDEVLRDPKHPYTKGLMISIPEPGVRIVKRPLTGLKGEPPSLLSPPSGCRFHPRCPLAMPICSSEEPPMVSVGGRRLVKCWLYRGERG